MRAATYAGLGVITLFVAGFVRGGLRSSPDPELVLAFSRALAALGGFGVLAGAVATGIHLARTPRVMAA